MTLETIINHLEAYNEKNGRATLCWEELDAVIEFLNHYKELLTECEQKQKQETVEHPAHYQGKIECIDIIEAMLTPEEFRGFCKGNTIKYLYREGGKGNAATDCKKAGWYLNRLIERKEDGND